MAIDTSQDLQTLNQSIGEAVPQTSFQSRVPPCQYVVLRGGSAQPERFNANSDEEALARLQKEVRAGQTTIVYCYKLFCAEQFVPSSKTITGDELAGLFLTPADPVNS